MALRERVTNDLLGVAWYLAFSVCSHQHKSGREKSAMPAEELPRETHDQEDTTEEHSFDELAKGVADGSLSRRRALKLLGRAFIGATFGFWFLRSTEARGSSVEAELEIEGSEAEQEIEQRIGGGGGGGDAGCPPERRCPRNTCCPAGEICARGGGVCCPPESVCTVGGVPRACCAGIGTCVNGVCVPSVP